MKAILAVNNLGYIGLNGKLPWKSSSDLNHFKRLTFNCSVLVGRKTFEHLPPLKSREIIVVGKGYDTLEKGLSKNPDWVIGGKELLESTLKLCDSIHLSIINDNTIGDTLCPRIRNSGFFGDFNFYYFDAD